MTLVTRPNITTQLSNEKTEKSGRDCTFVSLIALMTIPDFFTTEMKRLGDFLHPHWDESLEVMILSRLGGLQRISLSNALSFSLESPSLHLSRIGRDDKTPVELKRIRAEDLNRHGCGQRWS